MMKTLRIGDAAKQADVNVQTIRYYERRGLLPKPSRTESNYRMYSEDIVTRVRFIKRAQELGFTLKEIEELLSLRATPDTRCGDVRRRAQIKVRDIDDKIRTLNAMRAALDKLVDQCSGEGPTAQCPILEALDEESPTKEVTT